MSIFNLLKCVCCADWDKVLESLSIPRRELYKLEAETINRVLSDMSWVLFQANTTKVSPSAVCIASTK